MFVSPGARFEAELEKPSTFTTISRGELAASLQGEPWAAMPVREMLHLPYHRLVVVSTDAAVYVLTADEWSAQV